MRGKTQLRFSDLGEKPLKNIPSPVRVHRIELNDTRDDGSTRESVTGQKFAPPDKPSVAVLSFRNLSGDPEQTYFSDGISDDIIIELARCRELFVIARQSSFAYRDTSIAPAQIARELGVQYLVEGGVRRSGDRIRVTAQLIDPVTGAHLRVEAVRSKH